MPTSMYGNFQSVKREFRAAQAGPGDNVPTGMYVNHLKVNHK